MLHAAHWEVLTEDAVNGMGPYVRIIDQRWQNNTGGTPGDIDRYQYGYDLNSNRQYKGETYKLSLHRP